MPSAISCSLSPLTCCIHSSLFSDWSRTVSSKFLDSQVPSTSTEELLLPCHARCALSRLHCNGHSPLFSSYLTRIGGIENPSCNACGQSSQDNSRLILHCPATDSLHCLLFGDSLFLAKLLFKSNNLCGNGSSRIFVLPLPQKRMLPASASTSLVITQGWPKVT